MPFACLCDSKITQIGLILWNPDLWVKKNFQIFFGSCLELNILVLNEHMCMRTYRTIGQRWISSRQLRQGLLTPLCWSPTSPSTWSRSTRYFTSSTPHCRGSVLASAHRKSRIRFNKIATITNDTTTRRTYSRNLIYCDDSDLLLCTVWYDAIFICHRVA